MSILFLFGAGASFGAEDVYPKVPPLGKDLFRELDQAFPSTWGSLPYTLKSLFSPDFENGMNALWNSGSHKIPALMQHMAIFFSQFRLFLRKKDAYSVLFDNICRLGKQVTFSTLNYDCLFEIAVSMAGKPISYFEDETAGSAITIWKLHGSCNFLPDGGVGASRGVSFTPGVGFETGIKAVNLDKVPEYCLGNTGLYPVMSIYAQGKPVQIAATKIKAIQEEWSNAVHSAETIAIIGVNPHPPDGHIWNPLSETKANILFCGDEKTFSSWSSEYRVGKDSSFIGNHFNSSIDAFIKAL